MENTKEYIIILDNGHGENTPGKRSPDGRLLEYLYARDIVKRVNDKLKEKGYNPYILVPETIDISLRTRVKRANKIYNDNEKKALLISVHCNAAGSGSQWCNARGWSVFISSNASSKSKLLADCLKAEAEKSNLKIRLLYPDKSYWVLSLAMTRDTNCPSVLTENLFLDNKEDVDFLLSEEGKETISNIHVDGIIKYIENVTRS